MVMYYVAVFIVGIIVGMYIYKRYINRKNREMTTEDCVRILKDKGYWVNLNVADKK